MGKKEETFLTYPFYTPLAFAIYGWSLRANYIYHFITPTTKIYPSL